MLLQFLITLMAATSASVALGLPPPTFFGQQQWSDVFPLLEMPPVQTQQSHQSQLQDIIPASSSEQGSNIPEISGPFDYEQFARDVPIVGFGGGGAPEFSYDNNMPPPFPGLQLMEQRTLVPKSAPSSQKKTFHIVSTNDKGQQQEPSQQQQQKQPSQNRRRIPNNSQPYFPQRGLFRIQPSTPPSSKNLPQLVPSQQQFAISNRKNSPPEQRSEAAQPDDGRPFQLAFSPVSSASASAPSSSSAASQMLEKNAPDFNDQQQHMIQSNFQPRLPTNEQIQSNFQPRLPTNEQSPQFSQQARISPADVFPPLRAHKGGPGIFNGGGRLTPFHHHRILPHLAGGSVRPPQQSPIDATNNAGGWHRLNANPLQPQYDHHPNTMFAHVQHQIRPLPNSGGNRAMYRKVFEIAKHQITITAPPLTMPTTELSTTTTPPTTTTTTTALTTTTTTPSTTMTTENIPIPTTYLPMLDSIESRFNECIQLLKNHFTIIPPSYRQQLPTYQEPQQQQQYQLPQIDFQQPQYQLPQSNLPQSNLPQPNLAQPNFQQQLYQQQHLQTYRQELLYPPQESSSENNSPPAYHQQTPFLDTSYLPEILASSPNIKPGHRLLRCQHRKFVALESKLPLIFCCGSRAFNLRNAFCVNDEVILKPPTADGSQISDDILIPDRVRQQKTIPPPVFMVPLDSPDPPLPITEAPLIVEISTLAQTTTPTTTLPPTTPTTTTTSTTTTTTSPTTSTSTTTTTVTTTPLEVTIPLETPHEELIVNESMTLSTVDNAATIATVSQIAARSRNNPVRNEFGIYDSDAPQSKQPSWSNLQEFTSAICDEPDSPVFCCGSYIYKRIEGQICCNGIYSVSETGQLACCGAETYDISTSVCVESESEPPAVRRRR